MAILRRIQHRAAQHFARRNINVRFARPIISFCFDDFPKSAGLVGADVISEEGARASFYPCADLAGKTVDGIRQYDRDDLPRLAANGHEIGCHTAGHTRLPDVSMTSGRGDIERNARFLIATGIASPRTFAYPFGDVTVAVKKSVSPLFMGCRGVWRGVNSGAVDLALLKAVCLEPHILAEQAPERWIEKAAVASGWVIFVTHDVAKNPSQFGVTPRLLREVARAATRFDAEILPVSAVIDRIGDASKTRALADS